MASAKTIDEQLAKYKLIQEEIAELSQQRTLSFQQANENGMVKAELDILEGGASVYKVMGPVLLSVDLEDAKQNVEKRLDLIKTAMEDIENKIQAKQKEGDELGNKIMEMQQHLQAKTAEAARAVAAGALKG